MKCQFLATKRLRGNTIIEVLIATIVVGTVLTALALLMSMNVKNNAEADYREQASRYAQESIDNARANKARVTWSAFTNAGFDVCAPGLPTKTIYGMVFTRSCVLTKPGADDGVRILTVTITWNNPTDTLVVVQHFYDN